MSSKKTSDSHNMGEQRRTHTIEGGAEHAGDHNPRQDEGYPVDYDNPREALNTDAPESYGGDAKQRQEAMQRAARLAPNQRGRGQSSRRGGEVFKFTTPDSGRGEGPPKDVHIIEPTPDLMDVCFELAGEHEKRGDGVFAYQAQLNQVRMCIKQFGDQHLTFEDLKGDGLQHHITPYELQYILKGLERLTSPPDAKVQRFLDSMQIQPA